ncbi:hypothetical protein NP233_g8288 [Leucocoprinus birnbaumii]|uniref:Uncharacterized protein n=1 Tax=Leucocoprinus birnbaumii TaxID=56174 RepID=A0AAD5VMR4_9AGAR|nr:hypothetical protein NP233_g8288 [Leucocoprinus birnbaumii]
MELDVNNGFDVEEVHAVKVVGSELLKRLMDHAFEEENVYLEQGLMCDPDAIGIEADSKPRMPTKRKGVPITGEERPPQKKKQKYTYVSWDGKTPRPLIDTAGVVFGVLAGRPNDDEWLRASERLYEAMRIEASGANFTDESLHDPKVLHHGRGHFPAINAGITPGQGSQFPHMVDLKIYDEMISRLLKNKDLQYLADWHSWCIKAWSPDLYDRLKACLDKLHAHPIYGEGLERITPAGIFPAAAFNFGPNATTDPHRDVKNYAFGWCSIQPVGPFKSEKGGHIFFDDLRLVVQFPSGSVILIPSATLTHANIRVTEGDERASFTQYFPAGILRFVENGFRTEKKIKKSLKSHKAKLEFHERKSKGSEIGMRIWKRLPELIEVHIHN